jgi:hypothetical protein
MVHPTPSIEPKLQPMFEEEPEEHEIDLAHPVDAAMVEYVGYLASWFEIGRLAACAHLSRAGVRTHLLSDG